MRILRHTLICLLCFISFLLLPSCSSDKANSGQPDSETYTPKGDLSDLVYNPVREDGTIDSSFLPIITWTEVVYDFGSIFEGDVARHTFSFTNTGTAPLLIVNATSSCGCTVPEWTDAPIPIDSTGSITVKFDSKGRIGDQSKEVTIFANTYPNKSILTIKGKVTKTNQ